MMDMISMGAPMNRYAVGAGAASITRESADPALAYRHHRQASQRRIESERADRDRHWSQLMAAAQQGDRSAYDRLLREIVPYIRTIARHHHSLHDRVDEVVQDVLLTVHRVRHSYDPARPFRHWLASIARCRSIDALRSHGRRSAQEVAAGIAGLAYEAYADPAASRHENAPTGSERLGRAIADLPALQREAIELLKLREMSLAEAAAATGRSIAALKVNAHRAIKSLQKQFRQRESS